MKVTDNAGISTVTSTAGDLEAIVVIYDPSGGYSIGGGWTLVSAGSLSSNPGQSENSDLVSIPSTRMQNGASGYNFILTVVDGNMIGGDGVDRFRLKIWNKATGAIVFDNQMGASDAANPTAAVGQEAAS